MSRPVPLTAQKYSVSLFNNRCDSKRTGARAYPAALEVIVDSHSSFVLDFSMMAARGRNIAEAITAMTAYRLAGPMFLPMSTPMARLARMARAETAKVYPAAPMKAVHCEPAPQEDKEIRCQLKILWLLHF